MHKCTLVYTTSTHTWFALLDRSGLGLIVESDFYTTPAGRAHFANQLQSIRYWCALHSVYYSEAYCNLNWTIF